MDYADFVPKKIAIADDSRAKVVLAAPAPHTVKNISEQFAKLYGIADEKMIVGRTLRAIFGPKTDIKKFHEGLQAAVLGKTQHISIWTSKPDMSQMLVYVSIFPVAEDAQITLLMLVFKGGLDVGCSTAGGRSKISAEMNGAKCGPVSSSTTRPPAPREEPEPEVREEEYEDPKDLTGEVDTPPEDPMPEVAPQPEDLEAGAAF
eukprot:CAMPEP_0184291922 /NCGR_PEP_ID=MMETSP1049-20130417/3793_1 /TAXON_ID=77928 /ORGANISM="Proteomonas sulcata, Strain CCMP704" /LENGTH=203 /DNA_ID=CAMNT_0026599501 /DNA_START=71 /DNA_END=682 /DNA_ORIENTATION=-